MRWLARHDLLADPEVATWSNAPLDPTSLDACLEGALGIGQLSRVDPRQIAEGDAAPLPHADEDRFDRLRRGLHVADALGWSLHAATLVADWDPLFGGLRKARSMLFITHDMHPVGKPVEHASAVVAFDEHAVERQRVRVCIGADKLPRQPWRAKRPRSGNPDDPRRRRWR